jgi:hypothetical protein
MTNLSLRLHRFIVILIMLTMFLTVMISLPLSVSARSTVNCTTDKNQTFLGLPKWYKYLEVTRDDSGRCSPTVNSLNGALPIGLAVLEGMLRLASLVAVVMIFVAGFRYITSQGNPDAAAAARKTAINALIGLVIVVMATGLVSFIGNRLT